MEEKNLKSWDEFEKEILVLESLQNSLRKKDDTHVSQLLFRGQADARWRLSTTLERYTNKENINALEYFILSDQVRPQIETYIGKIWNINKKKYKKWTEKPDLLFLSKFPATEYMIYLRHQGFPSPLLDWTKSPFVAGYFAFNKSSIGVENVAIYAYIEWAGRGKSQTGDNPTISSLPSNVPSHKRHFVQQSAYTICAAETKSGLIFSSHEKGFSMTEEGENLLWKFTIPYSERINILRKMDKMNINSLSLFDDEGSLMETLALRAFYLNQDESKSA
jgi:hypothetical protein